MVDFQSIREFFEQMDSSYPRMFYTAIGAAIVGATVGISKATKKYKEWRNPVFKETNITPDAEKEDILNITTQFLDDILSRYEFSQEEQKYKETTEQRWWRDNKGIEKKDKPYTPLEEKKEKIGSLRRIEEKKQGSEQSIGERIYRKEGSMNVSCANDHKNSYAMSITFRVFEPYEIYRSEHNEEAEEILSQKDMSINALTRDLAECREQIKSLEGKRAPKDSDQKAASSISTDLEMKEKNLVERIDGLRKKKGKIGDFILPIGYAMVFEQEIPIKYTDILRNVTQDRARNVAQEYIDVLYGTANPQTPLTEGVRKREWNRSNDYIARNHHNPEKGGVFKEERNFIRIDRISERPEDVSILFIENKGNTIIRMYRYGKPIGEDQFRDAIKELRDRYASYISPLIMGWDSEEIIKPKKIDLEDFIKPEKTEITK